MQEHARVQAEIAAENLRVSEAKALASLLLILAASGFGIFMALALYLIFAKIENNLRGIDETLESYVYDMRQHATI